MTNCEWKGPLRYCYGLEVIAAKNLAVSKRFEGNLTLHYAPNSEHISCSASALPFNRRQAETLLDLSR